MLELDTKSESVGVRRGELHLLGGTCLGCGGKRGTARLGKGKRCFRLIKRIGGHPEELVAHTSFQVLLSLSLTIGPTPLWFRRIPFCVQFRFPVPSRAFYQDLLAEAIETLAMPHSCHRFPVTDTHEHSDQTRRTHHDSAAVRIANACVSIVAHNVG